MYILKTVGGGVGTVDFLVSYFRAMWLPFSHKSKTAESKKKISIWGCCRCGYELCWFKAFLGRAAISFFSTFLQVTAGVYSRRATFRGGGFGWLIHQQGLVRNHNGNINRYYYLDLHLHWLWLVRICAHNDQAVESHKSSVLWRRQSRGDYLLGDTILPHSVYWST